MSKIRKRLEFMLRGGVPLNVMPSKSLNRLDRVEAERRSAMKATVEQSLKRLELRYRDGMQKLHSLQLSDKLMIGIAIVMRLDQRRLQIVYL